MAHRIMCIKDKQKLELGVIQDELQTLFHYATKQWKNQHQICKIETIWKNPLSFTFWMLKQMVFIVCLIGDWWYFIGHILPLIRFVNSSETHPWCLLPCESIERSMSLWCSLMIIAFGYHHMRKNGQIEWGMIQRWTNRTGVNRENFRIK